MTLIDPSYCRQKILDMHGQKGVDFLARLPALVAECAARWHLEVLPPFPVESYSYVAPAVRGAGEPVVLKVGVPDREFTAQIDALRYWDGSGTCRLLDADAERGFLLMERVLPGQPLKTLTDDEEVTRVAIEVMRRLWKPAPSLHAFPTVKEWAADLDRLGGPFAAQRPVTRELSTAVAAIERTRRQFAELIAEAGPPMLIHGDMNWGNILSGEREPWLVIDPKGVVGCPLYDVATFLNDPPEGLSMPELRRLLSRRIAQIAEGLGVEREAVRAWAQAHLVLAGVWVFEEHHGLGWENAFAVAELYDGIT